MEERPGIRRTPKSEVGQLGATLLTLDLVPDQLQNARALESTIAGTGAVTSRANAHGT